MIIVPELETVVLLVPRTGSGSLWRAVMDKYPRAFMPYRHMEADGIPAGYDRWKKVGVLRNPIDRLWSLYKFCKHSDRGSPFYLREMRASVSVDFSDWIVSNQVVFCHAYDGASGDGFRPIYLTKHNLPETRKSQFQTLRPDLGTTVWPFEMKYDLANSLNVDLEHHNVTDGEPRPTMSTEALLHVARYFAWDHSEWSRLTQRMAA